ncbi:MAG: PQQ-dependent sugar dehydrogenase [Bryobacteraceae bacterium]|nr:PQQ-dependent sugar dehydrogenase [Bryobacteraceae bacterium]
MLLLAALAMPAQEPEIRFVEVAAGLPKITDIQSPRDGSGRLFVVRQPGVIAVIRGGALLAAPALNIQSRTSDRGSECGLLGLAFPPGFEGKRYFYVNYTNPNCTESVIARYRLSGDDVADTNSEEVILRQAQPFTNHNGGQLQFGPDGYLYIGLGDGGSGGDPRNSGQTRDVWLGKMLRIDTESGVQPYAVPASNPFVADSRYRPEIWALGLRNPWRFSFDRETGDLWIADVGQNRAEEINFQSALSTGGENYGWRLMEGMSCFNPSSNCDRAGLTLPVHEYTRGQGDVSVTGGYVYRGARWPSLRGTYIYGDYASGRIWGIRRDGGLFNNRLLIDSDFAVSTFGEGEDGEIYVADHGGGKLHRIEAAGARPSLTSRSIVNAASFEVGLTPGSVAALFTAGLQAREGITSASSLPLPRMLDDVRVAINGVDAPLYDVANVNGVEQVNFQAPFELTGSTATVTVSRGGAASNPVTVPVLAVQPGVFALDGTDAIIVDPVTNSLVTRRRPLRRGETVYFYATGLGPVNNPPAAGDASPAEPLSRAITAPAVAIGGVPCEVTFAGLAPSLAGVYQVNLRIAMGVTTGTQDLVLSSGSTRSLPVRVTVE